ncbi:MAG: chorismate mutase, partial [Candidatus Acinetobacter avistercoris]|nr:chorismate mutase [Candidatus Acinetobacter avistercoris]
MNKDKCESLSETREKIDAIDNDLIALIAQRQFYVDQAMRFKSSVQDVQSPERVE